MNFDNDISIVRYPMCLTGLWPLETSRYVTVKFVISLALNVTGVILNVRQLLSAKTDAARMKVMFYLFIFAAASILMCLMKKNQTSTIKVLNSMNRNWKSYKHLQPESQVIMYEQRTKTKKFITIYYILTGLSLLCAAFDPLVVVLVNKTPLIKISDEKWYSFFTIVQVLAETCCAVTLAGIQCFIVLTILHVCGQINVLCHDINNYKEDMNHTVFVGRENDLSYCNCLKCITNRHNSISKISTGIEDCMSPILFTKFLMNGIEICMAGFLLIRNETSIISKIATIFLHLVSLAWSCLVFGWLGDQLSEHGYKIGDAVYSTNWYEFSQLKRRRILSVIICRAQKPIRITAGKYFLVTLKNVCQLFITWMSYISVLNAVK